MTIPPAQMRFSLRKAGDEWDAVRVSAATGRTVLTLLGDEGGAAIADDDHLWVLVPSGTGSGFDGLPSVTVYGRGDLLYVPADRLTRPPGLHWARGRKRGLNSPYALRTALGKAAR